MPPGQWVSVAFRTTHIRLAHIAGEPDQALYNLRGFDGSVPVPAFLIVTLRLARPGTATALRKR